MTVSVLKYYNTETEQWEIAAVGKQGPTGNTGPSGVVTTTSPITNSGTSTEANIGINYSALQYGQNAIINGAFDIWQRGTSFTNIGAGNYMADRWIHSGSGGNPTTQVTTREAFTPGAAPVSGVEGQFFLRSTITAAGSATLWEVGQRIEDVRTLAGQTVTLSFYAKADSSRSSIVYLAQIFGSGGSSTVFSSTPTLSLTSSWARYSFTLTVPSISGKTIGSGSYLSVNIRQAVADGSVLDLWGVQLETGSVATPFKRNAPSIQAELAACQRYYIRYPGIGGVTELGSAAIWSTTNANVRIPTPVSMRIYPISVEFADLQIVDTGLGTYPISSVTLNNGSSNAVGVSAAFTGGTQHRPGWMRTSSATGFIGFSAEL